MLDKIAQFEKTQLIHSHSTQINIEIQCTEIPKVDEIVKKVETVII